MKRKEWEKLLNRNPADWDCRQAYALWLCDEAPATKCRDCGGRGWYRPFANGVEINPCAFCVKGYTDRRNLLFAQCLMWMRKEKKCPKRNDTGTDVVWDWWGMKSYRENVEEAYPMTCHLPNDVFVMIPIREVEEGYSFREFPNRRRAEIALMNALARLQLIRAERIEL